MGIQLERGWLKQSWQKHKELIGSLGLKERERGLLELRWFEEAKHYDEVWRRRRLAYVVLGCATIVAGLAIPLLAAVGSPRWSLAAVGFLAGLGGALEGFFDFGQRWRQQRRTAVLMKNEGLRFIALRGPYAPFRTHGNAFDHFMDRLEGINQVQSEAYLALAGQEPGRISKRHIVPDGPGRSSHLAPGPVCVVQAQTAASAHWQRRASRLSLAVGRRSLDGRRARGRYARRHRSSPTRSPYRGSA